ncbi:MAG TPA: DUF1428 domain-containing protein [Allosphingosinicella sp.]|nr:DUF1428 domain-containing protein [Allosphingosinicella sp.]
MAYIEGFVIPVPQDKKDLYREMAAKVGELLIEHGAQRLVEAWGDDVPHGKVTDFHRAVDAQEGESVVFAWIVWPSKQVREEAHGKIMADPRMQPPDMPMDGKRMIFGGFETLLDIGDKV